MGRGWPFAADVVSLLVLVGLTVIGFTSADEPVAFDPARLPAAADVEVDFARDVQPLLAERCHECHGADLQEAGLRLDIGENALRGGDSGAVIVPEHSAESLLVRYISGLDPDVVMPPDGEPLTAAQVALIRAWIDQGAKWPEETSAERPAANHWSFRPIERHAPPEVERADWIRNPIDAFIAERLASAGIAPSPEALPTTLVRRLSLDLLGLPPTPEEVETYLADTRPDAYERLVDRLLESPHYGERWGRHWLDLARYADSDGYEKDSVRPFAWRYRDWVIDALNRDLPFDQFTIEQLAGDLLPDASLDQLVATGFHRNTLTNREGGVDQEEFRVRATVDRTNTTGQVWLGLTVGCAECHSHKYDPLSHREYYELYAFFNSLDEKDIPAPLPRELAAYERAKAAHDAEHARLIEALDAYARDRLADAQRTWEAHLDEHPVVWATLDPQAAESAAGATLSKQDDLSVLAEGDNPNTDTYTLTATTELSRVTAIRLEVLADERLPASGPGRVKHGNFVLNDFRVSLAAPGAAEPVSVALLGATSDYSQDGWDVAGAIDEDAKSGWAIAPRCGQRHVAVFPCAEPISLVDGARLMITLDQQYGSSHTIGRLRLSVTAEPGPHRAGGTPDEILAIATRPAADRSDVERERLAAYYRTIDPKYLKRKKAVDDHAAAAPAYPATKAQALAETESPRETHIHLRGDFLRKGDAVEPQTPAALPPLTCRGDHPDRLDLAHWLVDPANPLTARVTANRVWQRLFGRGLVGTVEDFGIRGEPPSHPELLDWLATDFVAHDWSLKQIIRRIVTSATYRQSSAARTELLERDPQNVLLARQNRVRLEAETIRDVFLAASGLLDATIGGPSVRPPLPAGVAQLGYAGSVKWAESKGTDKYRRGLYIFYQRTVPYPMLSTFDAPDSTVACLRRERSNTPLQALTLLNDPVFFECAQELGRRIVAQRPGGDATERIRYAYRLCLARDPDEYESAQMGGLLNQMVDALSTDPQQAALVAGAGLSDDADAVQAAAWTVLGRTIMNLDEFVTRE